MGALNCEVTCGGQLTGGHSIGGYSIGGYSVGNHSKGGHSKGGHSIGGQFTGGGVCTVLVIRPRPEGTESQKGTKDHNGLPVPERTARVVWPPDGAWKRG